MKKLIIIAAVGKNNELGKNNDLIWKIKGDMKFFKEKTSFHHILMGKKTFYSLPGMLPNRKHIVLTTSNDEFNKEIIVLNSIAEFDEIKNTIDDDIFVIGGASIYNQFIDSADMMYLTEIDDECIDADVYFPSFDDADYEKEIILENNESVPKYKHILYKKKKNDR